MAKRPHPADAAAEDQMIKAIRSAERFMASLFCGTGHYEKRTAPTVFLAMQEGEFMEKSSGLSQRFILYAIGSDGRAVMITRALVERLMAIARKDPA